MAGTNLKDARKWLQESNVHYIGSDDWGATEDTNDDSIKIVEELYEKGAIKVEVELLNETDDFACELFVTLPTDEQKARAVLCYLGELHADDLTEKDGVAYVAWGD